MIDASSDNKSFLIKEDNSTTQIIEEGETYTQWTWNVTPIRTGNSKLNIVISIIRDSGKKEVVYSDTVDIQMDLKAQIIFFLQTYWQFILTSMVIPFLVWLWKNRKKKEAEEK